MVHARGYEGADRREGEGEPNHGPQLRGEALLRPLEAIRAVPSRRSLPDGVARQPSAGGDFVCLGGFLRFVSMSGVWASVMVGDIQPGRLVVLLYVLAGGCFGAVVVACVVVVAVDVRIGFGGCCCFIGYVSAFPCSVFVAVVAVAVVDKLFVCF